MLNLTKGIKDRNYKVEAINIKNKSMLYRLSAFGLTKGTTIKIKQKCLLNGPSVVEINGQYLSIRQRDAHLIVLEE
ncbi:FeoA domain-containing protein [Staphylococcus sp. NRL 16/872]|uniref:FeoA family protein n=1 Tax=Staphylococcus sp. NRL 16/872 TaxID=2930131 RepID=UPI001FB3FDDF|nr:MULTISPECIES: FeoA domain-containing protein [unclassified Staphylococcus]MCJ1655534.1 FeoA domain-containing protein [Staphylococcus sp. NRL 21/187]MCJ1661364.1 FeoA domain-containing protein [Staphylococcus sp. NRL 18/288]MCJ1667259.1 FeoA domain-containing protein [Staphylococcus sp. NRL 19/737]WEN69743.1 FeoA domain-containing protein [Staphylococcus sp. NRL 16/872]